MDMIIAVILVNCFVVPLKLFHDSGLDTVSFEMPVETSQDKIPFYVDGKLRCYMSIGV